VTLASVTLYSAGGSVLANYSPSGPNWTTGRSVEISQPDVFAVASATNLLGEYLAVTDPATGSAAHSPID